MEEGGKGREVGITGDEDEQRRTRNDGKDMLKGASEEHIAEMEHREAHQCEIKRNKSKKPYVIRD